MEEALRVVLMLMLLVWYWSLGGLWLGMTFGGFGFITSIYGRGLYCLEASIGNGRSDKFEW